MTTAFIICPIPSSGGLPKPENVIDDRLFFDFNEAAEFSRGHPFDTGVYEIQMEVLRSKCMIQSATVNKECENLIGPSLLEDQYSDALIVEWSGAILSSHGRTRIVPVTSTI